MSSKQQQNNRQNYLIPIQFQLIHTQKSKTYLVNSNWTIEEFIRFIKYQLFLDADYYGVDVEKQQQIDFVPCFSKYYFDLTSFYLNDSYCHNDYKKYDVLEPSAELFKDYFDYHYPSSFTVCTKVSNPYYPYYYYAN